MRAVHLFSLLVFAVACGRIRYNPISGGGSVSGDAGNDAGQSSTAPRLIYGQASAALASRVFDPQTETFATPLLFPSISTDVKHVVVAPTSRAVIFGAQVGTDPVVLALGDASQDASATAALQIQTATTSTERRYFDLAGMANGDVLVVYSRGMSSPRYRIWNGSGWSSEANVLSVPPNTGAVEWVRLVTSPDASEVTLLYSTADRELVSVALRSNTWVGATRLATNLTTRDFQAFDAAYEQQSSDVMVIWGVGSSLSYATRALGNDMYTNGTVGINAVAGPEALASETGSNRIAAAVHEVTFGTGDDAIGLIWDGTTWISFDVPSGSTSDYESRPGSSPIAIAWSNGSVAMVYQSSGQIMLARWSSGPGWTAAALALSEVAGTPTQYRAVGHLPDGRAVFLVGTTSALFGRTFNGTAWGNLGDGSALTAVLSTQNGTPFALTF